MYSLFLLFSTVSLNTQFLLSGSIGNKSKKIKKTPTDDTKKILFFQLYFCFGLTSLVGFALKLLTMWEDIYNKVEV